MILDHELHIYWISGRLVVGDDDQKKVMNNPVRIPERKENGLEFLYILKI